MIVRSQKIFKSKKDGMFTMKNRVDKAIATIRGYCDKVVSCDKCRYSKENDDCPFSGSIPADWKMDVKEKDSAGVGA